MSRRRPHRRLLSRHVTELTLERGDRVAAVHCLVPERCYKALCRRRKHCQRAGWHNWNVLSQYRSHYVSFREVGESDLYKAIYQADVKSVITPGLVSASWAIRGRKLDLRVRVTVRRLTTMVQSSLARSRRLERTQKPGLPK